VEDPVTTKSQTASSKLCKQNERNHCMQA